LSESVRQKKAHSTGCQSPKIHQSAPRCSCVQLAHSTSN
jgi:hypothetical protein